MRLSDWQSCEYRWWIQSRQSQTRWSKYTSHGKRYTHGYWTTQARCHHRRWCSSRYRHSRVSRTRDTHRWHDDPRSDSEITIYTITPIIPTIRNSIVLLILSFLYSCSSVVQTRFETVAIPPTKSETITSTISIPPCIHGPRIEYFMYHYIRSHDPHDNVYTSDLSVDPQEFRKQMSYIDSLRKE
jgi:hypothetical protein